MARKTSMKAEEKPIVSIEQSDNHSAQMPNNQVPTDAAELNHTAYSRSRCGGALRIAREKQGLAVQDVASKLKISGRQIQSIEADEFTALPESTIVRGFIRNYAKLLKIDVEPLLDAYNVLVPSKEPLAFTLKPSTSMKVNSYKKPKTGRYIWGGLLVLLVLGTWFFYQSYIEKPSPIAPTAEVEILEPLPEPALPLAERAEQTVDITLPAVAAETASAEAIANPPAVATDASQMLPATETPALPEIKPTESAEGLARLEFNASQETWVSIVDAKGKEIYNKTIFAGSRDSLNVKLPINVVVGNARGATVTMNNKLIDLAPHTRSNVARIKVDKFELNQFE